MREIILFGVSLLLVLHRGFAHPTPAFTGDLKVDGSFILTAGATDSWVFFTPNGGNNLLLSPHWDGSKETAFEENGDVRFSRRVPIGNVGALGINTLTLAVGGKIGARSMHVVSPSMAWPDYVFSGQYPLRPLSEVEQFVQANCHLPNVPSASQVQATGVDLGEM